jgi:hypothetical protein
MRYQLLRICLAIIFATGCVKKEEVPPTEVLPAPAPAPAPASQQIPDPVSDSVDAAIKARQKEERENSSDTNIANPTAKGP